MEELSTTPFVSEFQLVCVDPSPSRPSLPRWLKSVPSLVIQGESSPRVGPSAVNNWLFERKQGSNGPQKPPQQALQERSAPLVLPNYSPDIAPRPDATSRAPPPPRGGAFPPAISSNTPANSSMGPANTAMEGPMAYHGSEMGSGKWSDNYSFVGETFSSEKGYNPIERNFESLIPANSSGVKARAAPPPKRSAKEEALLNEFQAYAAQRDRDVPGPAARQ